MSEKYIKPSHDIATRMMGGEMIVMSVRDSKIFNLNATASVIWTAADGCTPLRKIIMQKVVREFEVDEQDAYRDALTVVEELSREGILLIADCPFPEEGI
jgi:Coenzyme PQQ synthesis protein D (PqqD)